MTTDRKVLFAARNYCTAIELGMSLEQARILEYLILGFVEGPFETFLKNGHEDEEEAYACGRQWFLNVADKERK